MSGSQPDLESTGGIFAWAETVGNWRRAIELGGVSIIGSFIAGFVRGTVAVTDLFVNPIGALADALEEGARTFFIDPLEILAQGIDTTVASIVPGAQFDTGPFSAFVAMFITLGLFYMLGAFLTERETSNILPGAPFDIPSFGFFREEESTDDE